MIKKSKYCTDIIKKHFNEELVKTKEDDEDFENSTKCLICANVYIDGNIKVRNHCHINGKYRGSAHRNSNIKMSLNYKIPIVFHILNNYDSHLNMQELKKGKFDFKINAIPNRLEK